MVQGLGCGMCGSSVLSIPDSVQSDVWVVLQSRQQCSSSLSRVVVAEIHLCQMGGVGAQS